MFSIPFDVQRSIVIRKPVDLVYGTVADFSSWRSWSPWLTQEPDSMVEVSGTPGNCAPSMTVCSLSTTVTRSPRMVMTKRFHFRGGLSALSLGIQARRTSADSFASLW